MRLTNLGATGIDIGGDLGLQQVQGSTERVAEGLAPQEVRHDRQGQLVEVADELGRVREVGCVVGTARDVAEVDAREAVHRARVAAHGDGFGHDGGDLDEVFGEGNGAVIVDDAEGAAVPRLSVSSLSFVLAAGGGRYQLSGMRSQPGVQDSVPSAASVIAKKDLRVSLSNMPFGYSAEWLDIKAAISDEYRSLVSS